MKIQVIVMQTLTNKKMNACGFNYNLKSVTGSPRACTGLTISGSTAQPS